MTVGADAALNAPSARKPVPAGETAEIDQEKDSAIGHRRDEDWFKTVYAENSAWLLRFALRLTGRDPHRAEDVVQETFLRVWRFAAERRPGDTTFLRPWLATIARHVSINAYRRALRRPQEHYGQERAELAAVPDDTVRVLRRLPIALALRGLSQPHQQILIEMYFHRRTLTEASQLLHIAPGTAKSRLHHALRAMREALLRQGDAGLITG